MGEVGLFDGFGADAGRFGEDAEGFHAFGDFDDVGLFLDHEFGHVAVSEVDAAFVIGGVAGDIVAADVVVNGGSGASDGAADVVPFFDVGDAFADFDDLSEEFVSDDEKFEAGRWIAVEAFVDFLIGGVDADLEDLDEDAFSVRNLSDGWFFEFDGVDAVWLSGPNGYSFHRFRILGSGSVWGAKRWFFLGCQSTSHHRGNLLFEQPNG